MKKTFLIGLLVATIVFAGCNVSFTTANITDGAMSSDVKDGAPVDTVEVFAQDAPVLYAVGILNNAPAETNIRFVWNYVTEPQEIYEIDFTTEEQSGIYVFSELTNDGLWPIGDYNVEVYIDDRTDPDATIEFSVE
ncbi:MAG: hypothetical protein HN389_10520 [Clostridia bacterium]|jgi:hypothetical protein|nr:hypothetical protein [Clostridia bacterium]